jgi:hypothetical protein
MRGGTNQVAVVNGIRTLEAMRKVAIEERDGGGGAVGFKKCGAMRLEDRVPFDQAGFGTAMRNFVDNLVPLGVDPMAGARQAREPAALVARSGLSETKHAPEGPNRGLWRKEYCPAWSWKFCLAGHTRPGSARLGEP